MRVRNLKAIKGEFEQLFLDWRNELYQAPTVNVGEWQSQHDQSKFLMKEMLHMTFEWPLPQGADSLATETGARMPWAEDHFQERVSGSPLNPAPSEAWWPFRQKKDGDTNTDHKSEGEAFSHTYPERIWPKYANQPEYDIAENDPMRDYEPHRDRNYGIRFELGDLRDILRHLIDHPLTRQAYLPIWFPEDAAALRLDKRVPCTLGYHFIIRDGKLDISYFMRSTDLLRHFQDDVYMAGRLAQWIVENINDGMQWKYNEAMPQDQMLEVGKLIFHTANLHIFEGDTALIDFWRSQGKTWY